MLASKEGFDRLQTLVEHLNQGKLGHEVFDFNVFNSLTTENEEPAKNKCGFAGCAIGECPVVFEEWEFKESGRPGLRGYEDTFSSEMPLSHARKFFGITYDVARHLFVPNAQREQLGGFVLSSKATRYRVAQHIQAFINDWKGKEAPGVLESLEGQV